MSLSLNNSTIVPLLAGEIFLGKEYDNILDFAEIDISIKCDTGYELTYIYSQDKLTIDYETTQSIVSQITTQFYRIPVNDRYFKLKIEATDGDMSVLNIQTIYKSSTTYQNATGTASNVAISAPLNGDGSVFVGGSLTIGGIVDANITNTSLDVNVLNPVNSVDAYITNTSIPITNKSLSDMNFTGEDLQVILTNSSLDVNVLNRVTTDSNITNSSLNVLVTNPTTSVSVNNFPVLQNTSDNDTHNILNLSNTYLNSIDYNTGKFQFNGSNLYVQVQNFPSTQPISGSVDANVTNSLLNTSDTDTHTKLDSIITDLNKFIFNGDNLNTQVNNTVNVSDSDSHTSLTNINNNLNKFNKTSSILWSNSSTGVNGVSSAADLTIQNQYNLTFYGNVSGTTILTVQFSYDGNVYFDSQYSFNSSLGGDVGFTIQSSPNYVRMKSSLGVTATMYLVAN